MTSYRDWVVELSNTTGTVPYALAGAPAGTSYFTFRQRYPDGADEVVFWAVNKDRTKWEKNQLTTLTYGEPDLLTRHVVELSNGDAPVPWTSDDLPLRIYVVPDADAEQGAITGWLATVRHRLLRFGIWFKKDYPTAGVNTPMVYDGTVDTPLGVVPPGCVLPFAGATEPLGFLFCFGQAISRTTYAALFAAIGTAYGSGDGTTTFNVPDLRGRVAAGKGDMGTTDAGRLTATTMSPNGTTLGATGGGQTNTANTSMTSNGSTNGALKRLSERYLERQQLLNLGRRLRQPPAALARRLLPTTTVFQLPAHWAAPQAALSV